jgi:hypothetical protein
MVQADVQEQNKKEKGERLLVTAKESAETIKIINNYPNPF